MSASPIIARRIGLPLAFLAVVALGGLAILKGSRSEANAEPKPTAVAMSDAAANLIASLEAEEKETTLYPFEAPERLGWHFIPKDSRKGLQVKVMSESQREAAFQLLQSCLSEVGYEKATQIMSLEALLHELEKGRQGGNIRDPERYYFTLFGDFGPQGELADDARWGLSIEGHHLSLNFVVERDRVVSSTPTFFATNPAVVKSTVGEYQEGLRVLADEETLAFELVQSLSEEQLAHALIAEKALAEIRNAGEPQAPQAPAEGISFTELDDSQQTLFRQLIDTYADAMPADVAAERLEDIRTSGGYEQLTFAWAGALQPGIGHYYRVQGPTLLIEFVNTQPDAAGNPANHIHCVWRDPRGDFAIDVE